MNRSYIGIKKKLLLMSVLLLLTGASGESQTGFGKNIINEIVEKYMQFGAIDNESVMAVWYGEPIIDFIFDALTEQNPTQNFSSFNSYQNVNSDIAFFRKIIQPYTILLIFAVKGDGEGESLPQEKNWVHKKAKLVAKDGRKIKPIKEKKLPLAIFQLIEQARTGLIVSGVENAADFHFLVFPNIDRDGRLVVDYKEEGYFTLQLGKCNLVWRTPVGQGDNSIGLPF